MVLFVNPVLLFYCKQYLKSPKGSLLLKMMMMKMMMMILTVPLFQYIT